jgi:siroheme synthase (precorrin-2 oxidase/ferrochelatase)
MFLFSKIALSSKFVFMTIVEKKGVCELIKFKGKGPSTQQQRRETIEALISLPRV